MKKTRAPKPHPTRPVLIKQPSVTGLVLAAKLRSAFLMHQQGLLNEAEAIYEEILQSQPRNFGVLQLLAGIATQRKNFVAAVELFDKALKIDPSHAPTHYNRGVALGYLKRFDEALESYDRVLSITPDHAEAHWNLSLWRLLMGDFARGWAGYEWRWRWGEQEKSKRNFTRPLWLGEESLAGKTVLLHSEQGLGDTLQFCRYAKLVDDLGARVQMEVPEPLFALFKKLPGVAQLIKTGDVLPVFDYHCPLMSLPLAFKTDLNTIPAMQRYITSQPDKVTKWRARLGAPIKHRVGLVWSGRPGHWNDHHRSISLADLVKYLPHDYQYVSLQKDVRDPDKAVLQAHAEILHVGAQLHDFADTAAVCELMDVVVSVDTSVAHLAGAMGKPVWILLPFIPDWRWLLDRADSPWYPTAKLFRQPALGDWASVLESVRQELARYCAARC